MIVSADSILIFLSVIPIALTAYSRPFVQWPHIDVLFGCGHTKVLSGFIPLGLTGRLPGRRNLAGVVTRLDTAAL